MPRGASWLFTGGGVAMWTRRPGAAMPKATVTLRVAFVVECSDELMARMLDTSEDGMGPFYPSWNREEAWEKLARWIGLEKWRVSTLDGIADFPDDAADTATVWCELDNVDERAAEVSTPP